MPIIKSAIKKLRKDRKRTISNRKRKETLKKLIREARKIKSGEKLRKAISFVDKMAKIHLIHKNKAARLKSHLSKLIRVRAAKTTKKTVIKRKKVTKKSSKSL